ncbi:MarR family transcriptional regulator [Alsobacter sp. R-9]
MNDDPSLPTDQALQLRYHYVEFLTEHLTDCCRVFDGDLQEMLVLAVLGQVHVRALLMARPDGTLEPRAEPASRGINASRIADVTGIPRQTVRRKLDKLRARGWVEQRRGGVWVVTLREGTPVARDEIDGVGALDARSMERVLRMAQTMSRIIAGTKRPA